MIVLRVADTAFLVAEDSDMPHNNPEADSDGMKRCLIFLPCVTFGLAGDVQIIVSTVRYEPAAFTSMPYRHTRGFLLVLASISLIQTLCAYVFCFMVFGGVSSDPFFRKLVFASFIAKAVAWSPYLGLELYDTLFEQIYHDVNCQINSIRPANSRTASPRRKGSQNMSDAVVRPHQAGILSQVQEQNDCSHTGGNLSTANDEVGGSILQFTKPKKVENSSNSTLREDGENKDADIMQVQPIDTRTTD